MTLFYHKKPRFKSIFTIIKYLTSDNPGHYILARTVQSCFWRINSTLHTDIPLWWYIQPFQVFSSLLSLTTKHRDKAQRQSSENTSDYSPISFILLVVFKTLPNTNCKLVTVTIAKYFDQDCMWSLLNKICGNFAKINLKYKNFIFKD